MLDDYCREESVNIGITVSMETKEMTDFLQYDMCRIGAANYSYATIFCVSSLSLHSWPQGMFLRLNGRYFSARLR